MTDDRTTRDDADHDGDHTVENAEEQGGGYGGPFPVEPEQERTGGDERAGEKPIEAGDGEAGDA